MRRSPASSCASCLLPRSQKHSVSRRPISTPASRRDAVWRTAGERGPGASGGQLVRGEVSCPLLRYDEKVRRDQGREIGQRREMDGTVGRAAAILVVKEKPGRRSVQDMLGGGRGVRGRMEELRLKGAVRSNSRKVRPRQ